MFRGSRTDTLLPTSQAQRVQAESSVKTLSGRLEELNNKLAFETERLQVLPPSLRRVSSAVALPIVRADVS